MHVYPDDNLSPTTPRPMSGVNGRVGRDDLEAAAELLGVKITGSGFDIQPGDLYLTGRNTGVKLLTCKSVDPRNWINSTCGAYPYDTWECVKVEEVVTA